MKQGKRNSKQNSRSLMTTNFSCAQIWIFNVDADALLLGSLVLSGGPGSWGGSLGKGDGEGG